jgi:hypothetical protein
MNIFPKTAAKNCRRLWVFIYFARMKSKSTLMIIALAGGIFFSSCLKKDSRKQTEENLKTAMDLYLNHQRQIDTSRVKFRVLEVTFFEENRGYICNFKVNMKERRDSILTDTTGFMNANISKDFKDVTRRD